MKVTRYPDGSFEALYLSDSDIERYRDLVRSGGVEAIRAVLMGEDTDDKFGLLHILDWFMDPYYKNREDIEPFHDELVELLQEVIFSAEDADVAEEAWGLLNGYEEPPFEIIENRLDQLPPSLSWWVPRELEELKKLQVENRRSKPLNRDSGR